jgi:phenylpyruvate tautomerase PptA (4-oxalocrotonate tautomerase family)
MPDVLIEVTGHWLGDRKRPFIDAVHAAMVEALRIPPHDRVLRLIEHAPENFATPPNLGEKFTRIEVTMFAGRSTEAKRNLYRSIVTNLEPFGVPPNDVKIVLVEVPLENWGIRGGRAASDIDLGFDVRV